MNNKPPIKITCDKEYYNLLVHGLKQNEKLYGEDSDVKCILCTMEKYSYVSRENPDVITLRFFPREGEKLILQYCNLLVALFMGDEIPDYFDETFNQDSELD